MPRIRTIKPEFWTDEKLAQCCMAARLLFIATWNFADDHGGLDRSPKQLKAQAFPYDPLDCEPLIQELLGAGLLIEYEAGGKKYLHIAGFRKHQKQEKPAAPRFPVYSGPSATSSGSALVSSDFTATRSGATATTSGEGVVGIGPTATSSGSSLIGTEDKEGMLRDGQLAPCERSPAHTGKLLVTPTGRPRGHLVPFPPDFVLTENMRQQALRRCPDCDAERWFELFRAHHQAHGKSMRSWCAAWVTWIGNAERFGYPRRKTEGGPSGLPSLNA